MKLMWSKKGKVMALCHSLFMHNKDFSLYMYTPILSPSYILNALLQSILFNIKGRARELLPQVSKKKSLQHHKSVLNLYQRKLDDTSSLDKSSELLQTLKWATDKG